MGSPDTGDAVKVKDFSLLATTYNMLNYLVSFYGISTVEGYFMLNPVYTFTLNIYDLLTNSSLVIIFKQARAHLFTHN